MTPDPRDPTNPRGSLPPDDFDPPGSPAGLGPGDSLSPLPPAAEVKVRQIKAPRPLSRHPAVKYGGIGGLLAFLGGLIAYLFNRFFSDWTRP